MRDTRILVVRAGALGDTLMATPVLRALQQNHPGCEIDFLCASAAAALLAHNPRISRLFPLAQRNVPFALSPEKWRLVAQLRERAYDRAVLLESAPVFEALVRRAGVRQVATFRDICFDPGQHSIVNNLRVAGIQIADCGLPPQRANCGEPGTPELRIADRHTLQSAIPDSPSGISAPRSQPGPAAGQAGTAREAAGCDAMLDMELYVAAEDQRTVERWLGTAPAGMRLIGMHAGYGPRARKRKNQTQRLKGWDAGNFVRLARMLVERGFTIVLTGSAEDREDAERMAAELPAPRFQFAGRTTVGQLAAVIRQCEALVSVDSGPAHMAAALAVPLVVLWGPSRLEQVRPVSSRSPVCVVRHAVSCAPCYDTPMMRTCRRNICMEAISPERVLRELASVIQGGLLLH